MDVAAGQCPLSARPLAQVLTRQLALMAAVLMLFNVVAVGLYYGADRRALEAEAVEQMIERIERALDGIALPVDAPVRAIFTDYPKAYAFALVNRGGEIVEVMNADLIHPIASTIFADDWVTRLDSAGEQLLVTGHEFTTRADGLRIVFIMSGDPAGLLRGALLRELYSHVGIPILPVVLLLIGANALLIRRGLAPLATAAAWARGVRPGTDVPPPPVEGLPIEVADLVDATQRSLDGFSAALEAETRHAAEAAHALRTPVAVLVARLDALPPGETTTRLRADLSALSRTVKQVLAASRADRFEVIEGTTLDLRKSAQAVTASLAPFAYDKGVELALNQSDQPVLAQADAEGVELALSNVIENAILHGGPGLVVITVGSDPVIRVRDHGPGLPPGAMIEMFKPFWRGQGAASGGAGLGLAIVSRVQHGQGGTIDIQVPDEGGGMAAVLGFRSADY